jgi:hypothetical protein
LVSGPSSKCAIAFFLIAVATFFMGYAADFVVVSVGLCAFFNVSVVFFRLLAQRALYLWLIIRMCGFKMI